jgi:hypothetical protein
LQSHVDATPSLLFKTPTRSKVQPSRGKYLSSLS